MKNIRVSIFIPPDHPIAQKKKNERAAYAKELIEFALNYRDSFNEINQRIKNIEKMLEKGVSVTKPETLDEKTDKALNDALFSMLDSFGISNKKN